MAFTATRFPYGPITLSEICTAYGVGNNMGELRGKTYYNPDGTSAVVPQTGVNLRVFLGSANVASRIEERTIIMNYVGGSISEIDTRTEMFYTATESDYVGIPQGNNTMRLDTTDGVMQHGGDGGVISGVLTRNKSNEGVKINVGKFMTMYRPMREIKFKCYVQNPSLADDAISPFTLYCKVYVGGTTTLNTENIYENNSTATAIGTQVTRSITNTFPTTPSAILTYNIANNTLSIDLRRTIIIRYIGGTNITLDSQTEMFYTANESNYVGVSRDTGILIGTSANSIMRYSGNNFNIKSVIIDVNKFQTTYPSMTEIKFKCYARNNNSNKNATYSFSYAVYDNGINSIDSADGYVNDYSNSATSSGYISYLPDEFLTHIILTYNIANNSFSIDLSENIKRTIRISYTGADINLNSVTQMYYNANESYYVTFRNDQYYTSRQTSNDGTMRLIGNNSPTDELVIIDVNKFKKMYPSMTEIRIVCLVFRDAADIGGFYMNCDVYQDDTVSSSLFYEASLPVVASRPINFIYNIATNSLTQTPF